jgi:HAD superfamily hydrolase (TIGR01549 family)
MSSSCQHAMRAVRAIILDAGGVVLLPDLDWIGERAAEHGLRATRAQLVEAYYRTIYRVDLLETPVGGGPALTSLESRVWFFSNILRHAGADEPLHAGRAVAEQALELFPRESDIYHWALPTVRPQLEELRRRGFLLGMASNNDGALRAQLRSVGVIELFDETALMDSGVEGVAKPDPELLLRAARALGVAPPRCLFVGDVDRVDGQAARAASMPFALVDPLAQPRRTAPLCVPDLGALLQHFVLEG